MIYIYVFFVVERNSFTRDGLMHEGLLMLLSYSFISVAEPHYFYPAPGKEIDTSRVDPAPAPTM
jgi:hypothetical protein